MAQIVLITGCSSGIGLATACLFARDPEKRFIVYATILKPLEEETEFQETVGAALNDRLFPVQMDVTKEDMIVNAVAMIMEKHGRIDIVVNNAGVAIMNVSEEVSTEALRKLFDVNFFGTVRVMQEVLPIMKKQRSGRIINTSSKNGLVAFPYLGLYAASKHAILGFSQETAIVGRYFNIWVSLIEPGPVDTAIKDNIVALNLGGLDEIQQNPKVHRKDRRMSRCWENEPEYHTFPTQNPGEIADVILQAATDERPHFRYQTAEHLRDFASHFYKDITGDSFIDYQVKLLKPYEDTHPDDDEEEQVDNNNKEIAKHNY